MQQVIVALVAVTAVAALVGWVLAGTEGVRTVGWLLVAFVAVCLAILRWARIIRDAIGPRPVKPEDRERRRREREHRRRVRAEAYRRYRSVPRGAQKPDQR